MRPDSGSKGFRDRAPEAPQHRVTIKPLDVGITKALPGTYGGHESAAVLDVVDSPHQWMGAAVEAFLVFSGEDHDVVVSADLFKGSSLTAF